MLALRRPPSRRSPAHRVGIASMFTAAGLALTACGGGDGGDAADASSQTSKEDFCKVAGRIFSSNDLVSAITAKDYDRAVDVMHSIGEDLAKVGTPAGMSDAAREGYEISVKALAEVSADDMRKAAESATSGNPLEAAVSEADQKKALAYGSYVLTTCAGSVLPSGLPTDLPSDLLENLPTDLPSDLLENLPTDLPSDLLENLPGN